MRLVREDWKVRVLAVSGALFVALFISVSHAEEVLGDKPSDRELMALPEYCKARMNEHSPEHEAWAARLGPHFLEIHHYCFGLNYLNRYFGAQSERVRKYYLGQAVGKMSSVIDHVSDSFPVAGEMHLNRGYAYKLSGNSAAAIADFIKAVQLDPKLPQAYVRLIDSYVESNNKAKALELAMSGLSHLPGNKTLQRKYLQLGGKEPFPKPVEEKAATESKPVAPNPAGNAASSDASVKSEFAVEPGAVSKATQASGAKDADKANANSSPPTPAPIGAPGNPYCRFCP